MRYARVEVDGSARWAVIRDDDLWLLNGSPFDGAVESKEHVALTGSTLLAPVAPSKIVCLGRNYADHITEMGYVGSDAPSLFFKPLTTILEPGGTVVLPPASVSTSTEHEAELAVVIGKRARFVDAVDALDYVFGYTCADDVSARDLQRSDPHITRGKSFDTFCPLGPWIETDLDIDAGLGIRARVNGELRQDGTTRQMIFDVRYLISFISQFMTLLPGDVLLTGSPGGSGALMPGDTVEIEIDGIGTLTHSVAASSRE
jgi:2-keto-4-pentenoate hydratase/2-oxohepta-3-ene-1,7-dioic acid hydratase in catechol pathway